MGSSDGTSASSSIVTAGAGGERPVFPDEAALGRDDVHRRTALDPAHVDGGVGRIEILAGSSTPTPRLGERTDVLDDVCRGENRIRSEFRRARMCRAALDAHGEAADSLVGVHDAHIGRFADDGQSRLRTESLDVLE